MTVPWVSWDTVLASLRVMGWGMAGIMTTALAFWGAIVLLRRAFPPGGETGETPPDPRADKQA